ncbi:mycothiol synthase [Lacisediminihabitans changchengi]|uniref:Mycothiol acetyltransferase n=1 Tax=Lacisediminihabitans changchengi TaxID=2787634 RepID=A0A934SSM1_9MICO|nr:mycothiol synthase [Lacisediminihabitans changchengi]MBK4348248.1 mycothiol synthase [Lacisediminihabitans changchengi]
MRRQSIPDLDAVVARAKAVDGQPPFSDQALVDLRSGTRSLLQLDSAHAIVGQGEAEFVVEPDARGRGLGTAMLTRLLADITTGDGHPELLVWAHGDHPAARALAASHGLEPIRELLQLRRPVPELVEGPAPHGPGLSTSPGTVRAFRVGVDEDDWVALNARAFAHHPEQGSVTRADLEELERELWFDADDFLILDDGTTMVGYCWLKVEDGIGEFYVVGVDPAHQGGGAGRALMAAGFARLAARGIRTAALYVDADNVAAVKLYRSLGFEQYSIDIQYRYRAL